MSVSTLLRVAAIGMIVLFPLSCCVTTVLFGEPSSDGEARRMLSDTASSMVVIETPRASLGKLHRVESVEAAIESDSGDTITLNARPMTGTDWGDVITVEKLVSYGIELGDGQSKADMRFELTFVDDAALHAGVDGELRVTGTVRLPFIPAGESDVFDETVRPFSFSQLVRVDGPGVPPTDDERANMIIGGTVLIGGAVTVVLWLLNLLWPRSKGDPRTEQDLYEAALSSSNPGAAASPRRGL